MYALKWACTKDDALEKQSQIKSQTKKNPNNTKFSSENENVPGESVLVSSRGWLHHGLEVDPLFSQLQ